jgi:hypothetical protein
MLGMGRILEMRPDLCNSLFKMAVRLTATMTRGGDNKMVSTGKW